MKFVSLINFTEHGLRDIQHTTDRAAEFKSQASAAGVTITELLWLTGSYDGLIVMEADNATTAAAVMLQLARSGNITCRTMTAFDADEMGRVLTRIG